MHKMTLPVGIAFIFFLLTNTANAQYFGFGGDNKKSTTTTNTNPSMSGGKPNVLQPDQFKSKVNTLNQQTKQGLRNQLQQDLANKPGNTVRNVTPPAQSTPSNNPNPIGTAPTAAPTLPQQTPQAVVRPAQPQQPAPPPPNTVYSAPQSGTQSDIYTGFQSQTPPPGAQPAGRGTNQSGQEGWDIKY